MKCKNDISLLNTWFDFKYMGWNRLLPLFNIVGIVWFVIQMQIRSLFAYYYFCQSVEIIIPIGPEAGFPSNRSCFRPVSCTGTYTCPIPTAPPDGRRRPCRPREPPASPLRPRATSAWPGTPAERRSCKRITPPLDAPVAHDAAVGAIVPGVDPGERPPPGAGGSHDGSPVRPDRAGCRPVPGKRTRSRR